MPFVASGSVYSVYLIVFVDLFSISAVFPLLPLIADGTHFGASALKIGLLGAVAAAGEAVVSPLLGGLSDRIGRRPVMLLAIVGSAVSSVLTGLSGQYYWLLLSARLVSGVCGGTVGVCGAYLADVTNDEERPAYMNLITLPVSLGLALGPAAAAIINKSTDYRITCFFAAAISVVNVIAVFFLPESVDTTPVALEGGGDAMTSVDSGDFASIPPDVAAHLPKTSTQLPCRAWVVNIAGFLWGVGFASFEGFSALYIKDRYFDSDMEAATFFYCWLFVTVGVIIMLCSLFLYMPLLRGLGLTGTIVLGGVVRALGFCGGALAETEWLFLLSTVLWVAGEQVMGPSISTMLTIIVPPEQFGKALGWFQTYLNIARSLGPLMFAPLFDSVDHRAAFYVNGGLSLAVLVLLWLALPGQRRALAKEEVVQNETLLAPPAARACPPGRGISRMESEAAGGRHNPRGARRSSSDSLHLHPAQAPSGSVHVLRRIQSVPVS